MPKYKVQKTTPKGTERKTPLRLSIEALQPGDWLDTGEPPGRDVTRRICSMVADVKLVTGHRYTVKGDRQKGTTWVHCHAEHAP